MVRNKELINTKKTSEMLGVSTSTIRRWSNDGILPCYRVGESKYRKFELSQIMTLKEKFYGVENPINENINKPDYTVIENVSAESHPAHYLMHKYWGRKAHNIVNEYIKTFSKEGDTVLDPFMGSGVTVIESVKLKRNVVGIDINPISKFIVENTLSNVDLESFSRRYFEILTILKNEYEKLYECKCPICGNTSTIETAVWENDSLVRIKGICPIHGAFVCDATKFDKNLYKTCSEEKIKKHKMALISYPNDEIMQYVKRSGRNTIDDLFSDRALLILSRLRELILETENKNIKNLLLFCFTSMLSNVSKMLPGDKAKSTYKSGWVISKFWTPKVHTERNIFLCLNLRYKAILKGKRELTGLNPDYADIRIQDSTNISFLENNSIDYIFTDPPYGESIAYLALSHFWNSWLKDAVDYENEIIIDPYRKKGYDDYQKRIKLVYKELYRILKDEHYMSFTFHNRDLNVWKAIIDACNEAGFILESTVLQEQAVTSGTQGINKKNTLTGDFIYNFKKSSKLKSQKKPVIADSKKFIEQKLYEFIEQHNGATSSEIYEFIIPLIVKNNAYTDQHGHVLNIENILKNKFNYIQCSNSINQKIGGDYKWVKK